MTPPGNDRLDYKAMLGELEFAVSYRLRSWRKREANGDGILPCVVLTNDHLAEIVRRHVLTQVGLASPGLRLSGGWAP